MVSKAKSCADHKVGEECYILRYRNPGRTRQRYRKSFPSHRVHLPPHS